VLSLLRDVGPQHLADEVVMQNIDYLHLSVLVTGILDYSLHSHDIPISLQTALEHFPESAFSNQLQELDFLCEQR
jgi:hypothetical protein